MNFTITPSPVESLTSGSAGVWHVLGANLRQAAVRQDLRENLEAHFEQVPRPELCHSLIELLGTGEDDRFILYCPQDLIPKADWYRRYSEELDTYTELYLASWNRLLRSHDVRADFIDGDVPDLEDGNADLDKVVQAAYLAPILSDRGLISSNTIGNLMQDDDPVLVKSLKDALHGGEFKTTRNEADASERRMKWLKREQFNQEVDEFASNIMDGNVEEFQLRDRTELSMSVYMTAIRMAVEQHWLRGEQEQAERLYQKMQNRLLDFADEKVVQNCFIKTMRRLHSIGVADIEDLEKLNITFPNLAGPLLPNLGNWTPFQDYDDELLKVIYPITILCGSKLKGYARVDSDIDRAVFIKPEIKDREYVKRVVGSKIEGAIQFWLTEGNNGFEISVFDDLDLDVAEPTDAHILLGGVWEGDEAAIGMMARKLVGPYIKETNPAVRELYAESLERDSLQYRLLHRGYESCCAIQNKNVWLDSGYRWTAAKLYASRVFVPTV